MIDKNQMLFIHASVILPDKRILLRKRCLTGPNFSKWSATIERSIFVTDDPCFEVNKAILDAININLNLKHVIPKATIYPLNSITVSDLNRTIFPFIVEIKDRITLRSSTAYKFMAQPFSKTIEDVMCKTIYRHNLSIAAHTTNTVHVMKAMHIKGTF